VFRQLKRKIAEPRFLTWIPKWKLGLASIRVFDDESATLKLWRFYYER